MRDYNYYKNKKRKGRQFYDIHSVDKVINNIINVVNPGISIEQVKSKNRHRELMDIRLPAYWICYHVYDMPVTFIGNNLGRDHSTVIHGRDKIDDWYFIDKEFRIKFDGILKRFEDYKNR